MNIILKTYFSIALLMVMSIASFAQRIALPPNKGFSQYVVDTWDVKKGLPNSSLRDVLYGDDHFIWLASYNGLIRFDGLKFETFTKKNSSLETNMIYDLEKSRTGGFWVGTHKGLYFYKEGHISRVDTSFNNTVQVVCEDGRGVWVGTRGDGLFYMESGRLRSISSFVPKNAIVSAVKRDIQGRLWVGTEQNGLYYIRGQEVTHYDVSNGLVGTDVTAIYEDPSGVCWVGTDKGMVYCLNGSIYQVPELEGFHVNQIFEDEAGTFWVIAEKGIIRKTRIDRTYEFFGEDKGLVQNQLQRGTYDHEGSMWLVSNREGLIRVSNGRFENYTLNDGLLSTSISSLFVTSENEVLVGSDVGKVNIVLEDSVSVLPMKTDFGSQRIRDLLKDSQGNYWICTYLGLLKIDTLGNEKLYNRHNTVLANTTRLVYEDSEGSIWVGTRSKGLFKYVENDVFENISEKAGISSLFIMSIFEDNKGQIVVGTNTGGVYFFDKKGALLKVVNEHTGLPSDLVFNVRQDKKGVYWICTSNGLVRYFDKEITIYTQDEGLQDDTPFDFVEDNKGTVWIPTNRGIVKVLKSDFEMLHSGYIDYLPSVLYDDSDGLITSECTGAAHSVLDSDGRIWIPTLAGIQIIDPNTYQQKMSAPPVAITHFMVNGDDYVGSSEETIVIPPGQYRIVFSYTAQTFTSSSKATFKYFLKGFDDTWSEVSRDRQVVFTNLEPDEYTFNIQAANIEGVWNMTGDSVTFVIEPFFYQTWWFRAIGGVIVGLIFWSIFKIRTYRIRIQNERLEEIVSQRTEEVRLKNKQLEDQQLVIKEANTLFKAQNEDLKSSINYAMRIQQAILPTQKQFSESFDDYFILFQPRDVVSGDFYWFHKFENTMAIAAVDCTGHGVPGAFMSLIGNELLNQIIVNDMVHDPGEVLDFLHKNVQRALKQQDNNNRDGMDLSLCFIDPNNSILKFAGANNPLLLIRESSFKLFKGDRLTIGGRRFESNRNKKFKTHEVPLFQEDSLYIYSDGFQDQFGGPEQRKFMAKRLHNTLLDIRSYSMQRQKEHMHQVLVDWVGTGKQIDDVLLIGFRVAGLSTQGEKNESQSLPGRAPQ